MNVYHTKKHVLINILLHKNSYDIAIFIINIINAEKVIF